MATHSSVLAWRIPGTGEPGGLPSMGSHRVGHDWSDLAAAAAVIVASAYKYRCSSVVEGMRRFKQWTMIKPWEWMIYSYTQQQQCRSNLTNECRVEDPTWKKYTFSNFNYFQHFLRFFFDVDNFLSLYWICYNIVLFYVFWVFWPQGTRHLSSPTRDWICTHYIRRQSLNHWTCQGSPST